MSQIVFTVCLVAATWKQTPRLIGRTVSSRGVTLFPLTGEAVRHMDAKLRYLVQMRTGVQMCYSLSVGVCQSSKQNHLRPSVLLIGERGTSRCFNSNLWNYGHLCVCVCALLRDLVPSVCIVSLLDCSASSKLVLWDCFNVEHTHPHMHTCENSCSCEQTQPHITVVWRFLVSTDVCREHKKETPRMFKRALSPNFFKKPKLWNLTERASF